MKLRKLELTNVRRFGGKQAKLGPFGDGLTTITAENEAGKSTFFDALHALLFIAHGSASQEVKSLQPYSGGGVSIAAEIEIDDKDYRIEKTYLAQKSAKVIDLTTGGIIKQQGDAEAWIEENVNRANKGPAGLLWVRQGATHVDPEGKDKDAGNVATRRDLMSSVRGQIDAVTGGRRMDKIVERCRKDLDAIATKTLKAKAGSAWKQVEDQVEALAERRRILQADVSLLAQALEKKRRTKARLRDLEDAEKKEARVRQIKQAKDALDQANQHAQRVSDADKVHRLLIADTERLVRQIKDIKDAQAQRKELTNQVAKQEASVLDAGEAQKVADAALQSAQQSIAAKSALRQEMTAALTTARQAERSALKWKRLLTLAGLTQAIETPQSKLRMASAILAGPDVTQGDLDHMADLARRKSVAQEQRRAQFASFSVSPSGTGEITLDGESLTNEEDILIDRALALQISGFGQIALRPAMGSGKGIEDPEKLQQELDDTLEKFGFATVQAAREALNARTQASSDKEVARAEIRGLAPDGIDALNVEWQTLCADLGHPPGAEIPRPEVSPSAISAEDIEVRIASFDDEVEQYRSGIKRLQTAVTETASATATASGVLNHLRQERAALEKPQDEDVQLSSLEKACAAQQREQQNALEAVMRLEADAPDLDAAQAAHQRLLSVEKADHDEINLLERELARVNGAIETQSEGAVEEKLAEVEDQLAKVSERAARYEIQAKALALLLHHLDTARKDAQETYFEPIRNELRPLLAQIYAGASFELDPEKMLIGKVTRNGIVDDVTALSGGAYEQIAILTRLAFARLFAKEGKHVPVILDDALIHTDDERISTMFNMLSQVAREQQIIVLSCRTRAFSDLGGTRAFIDIADV